MKQFYKLNPLQIGSGSIVPDDFIVYTADNIPSELQEALDAEQVANELSTKIAEAKQYLASTDWYITRLAERNIQVPIDVTSKRLEAIQLLNY